MYRIQSQLYIVFVVVLLESSSDQKAVIALGTRLGIGVTVEEYLNPEFCRRCEAVYPNGSSEVAETFHTFEEYYNTQGRTYCVITVFRDRLFCGFC